MTKLRLSTITPEQWASMSPAQIAASTGRTLSAVYAYRRKHAMPCPDKPSAAGNLTFRLSPQDRARIDAARGSQSVSSFVRSAILAATENAGFLPVSSTAPKRESVRLTENPPVFATSPPDMAQGGG